MVTPILNLRVDANTKARWQQAADTAGCRLSEFIRDAVEAHISGDATPKPVAAEKPPRASGPAPGGCRADAARGTRCKLCGEVHKQ